MSKKRSKEPTGLRICYFDIETSNLNADFGVVLCAAFAINEGGVETLTQRLLNPSYAKGNLSDDSQVVEAIANVINQCDLAVAHNGTYFDLPFLRTRQALHGHKPLRPIPIIDPCLASRRKFRLARNDLNSMTRLFSGPAKTHCTPELWQKATLDHDEVALMAIEAHCRRDVHALRSVAGKFRGLLKQFDFNDRHG